jgi:uncharacterized membrane protein YeaQ/YmgE (transglycosylase-associated protein family)
MIGAAGNVGATAALPSHLRQAKETRMEGFWDALGTVTLLLLVLIGLLAGWIAGRVAGRNMPLYLALGVVGAIAAPFLIAALGLGVLAAGGILAVLVLSLVGALIVLVIAKAIFD